LGFLVRIYALLLLFFLSACSGGGSSTTSTASSQANVLSATDQSLTFLTAGASGAVVKTVQVQAADPHGLPINYSIVSQPAIGSASISTTGLLTYQITLPTLATSANVVVKVSNGTISKNITITIQIDSSTATDPLLSFQWHIKNQNSYLSSTNPASGSGLDLNIGNLWSTGIGGSSVNVTLVDTGMEIAHEDLSRNVAAGGSYNFNNATTDPTNSGVSGDHGTSVAGIIAGVLNNGVGISGIAPYATLRAYNFLSATQTYTNEAFSFGGDTNANGSAKTDIFNMSAGLTSASLISVDTSEDAIMLSANSLRSGKGAIVVKAAGNSFNGMKDSLGNVMGSTTYCLASGISCQNVNQDIDNTIYNLIVVASINADGTKGSYSSTGSSVWVSGFGGEYGYDTAVYPGSSNPNTYKPAILTTDQSGCNSGYARNALSGGITANRVNKGDGTGLNNATCNYTGTFNGTSAAAPTVSGVIALMLQANPTLTWRDVKHILALTARKISPLQASVANTTYFSPSTIILEQGWITNAANFNFHNYFGFGLVDATAAVNAAKSYVAGSLGTLKTVSVNAALGSTALPVSISGTTKTFLMSGVSKVEQAEIMLYVAGGFIPYCNQVELTSPGGTKSILLNMDSSHTSTSVSGVRLLSNAFYGESASGVWSLKVINSCAAPTQSLSATTPQQLTIRGH
jgi:subtilisin family serine protease